MDNLSLQQQLNYPFHYRATLDSTNDEAQAQLKRGADALFVVIADEQRKGRGRKGRVWHTPAGVAIAMSVILKPTPQQAHRISMIGALAVYDLCQHLGITGVGIKWPNDVQIDGKKVSGILPEAVWDAGDLIGVILGMGVNVRVQFTDDIAPIATNLEGETGETLNRADLIAHLMARIAYWYERIDGNELFTTWEARLNTLGQRVDVEGVTGIAQTVDSSGALLIKSADDRIRRVLAGDVSLIDAQT
jgi:BirA family transcriptional regulator, biotin operon repressor / biotin---[acetyl-CoA-carboxylase] ligase